MWETIMQSCQRLFENRPMQNIICHINSKNVKEIAVCFASLWLVVEAGE